MAAIPSGVLGTKIVDAFKKASLHVKVYVSVYTFAFILLVEILSAMVLRDTIAGGCNPYWYVLLTQLVLFMLFFNLYIKRRFLGFCGRQVVIVYALMLYYLIGVFCLVFNCSDWIYIILVQYGLLTTAFGSLILTIYNNKK